MRKEYRQQIRRAGLSATAREVMYDLGDESCENKPHVVINIKSLSESIGVGTAAIRRAVRELVEKGFLAFEGLVVSMYHKVYKLSFELLQKARKSVSRAVKREKTSEPTKMEFAEHEKEEATEVIHTLHNFGCFTKEESTEITYKHGVQKTKALVLEYLDEMKTGFILPARQWFQLRPPVRTP